MLIKVYILSNTAAKIRRDSLFASSIIVFPTLLISNLNLKMMSDDMLGNMDETKALLTSYDCNRCLVSINNKRFEFVRQCTMDSISLRFPYR